MKFVHTLFSCLLFFFLRVYVCVSEGLSCVRRHVSVCVKGSNFSSSTMKETIFFTEHLNNLHGKRSDVNV